MRAVVVRVHRLPQQHHLAEPLLHHLLHLTHHVGQLAAPLRPSRKRHDAVGAAIVAAALYGDPRLDPLEATRHHVLVMLLEVEVGGGELLALTRAIEERRQRLIAIRANDQRHMLGLIEHTAAQSLRHTPGDPDDGVGLHETTQFTKPPDHARFRVLANGTGIDQDDIGTIGRVDGLVPMRGQLAVHEFRIGHVHLATVGLDIDRGLRGHGRRSLRTNARLDRRAHLRDGPACRCRTTTRLRVR